MRLRYTGALPTTFIGVAALDPGDEFDLPDDQAERWLRRPDVEEVPADTPPARPRKTPKTPTPTDKQTAASAAPEEESGVVPDDH